MSFEDRLNHAIERGRRRSQAARQEAHARALTEEELKRLHSQYQLQLSEHIEQCVARLPHHFPGFHMETLYGERGWGAACSRDDLRLQGGRRHNDFSRLELTVRPFSSSHVLEVAAKGTVRNKELLQRNYFEKLAEVDIQQFLELVDVWVLEFAELYAARSA
jgi:hypothetical protein